MRPRPWARLRHAGAVLVALFVIWTLIAGYVWNSATADSPIDIFSAPAERAVKRAWWQAEYSGIFDYTSTIAQTSTPRPSLANVGRSSREDMLYIEGRVNRFEHTMRLKLWTGGGTLAQAADAIEIEVVGDQARGRRGGEAWQTIENITTSFAPGGDVLGYLAGATEFRALGSGPGAAERDGVQRYGFRLDGPRFARYMRDHLEQTLRRQGKLPPGLNLATSDVFGGMTGDGEVWLDAAGLPLKLAVEVAFPPTGQEQIAASITTYFHHFRPLDQNWWESMRSQGPIEGTLDWLQRVSRMLALRYPDLLPNILIILLAGGMVGVLVARRPSRQVQAALATATILALTLGPLWHARDVAAFGQEQAASAAAEQGPETAQQAAIPERAFDPRRSPLEEAALRQRATRLLGATLQSTAQPAATSDHDGDSLTYAQELALGTDPDVADSDGDALPDGAEVRGFATTQQQRPAES